MLTQQGEIVHTWWWNDGFQCFKWSEICVRSQLLTIFLGFAAHYQHKIIQTVFLGKTGRTLSTRNRPCTFPVRVLEAMISNKKNQIMINKNYDKSENNASLTSCLTMWSNVVTSFTQFKRSQYRLQEWKGVLWGHRCVQACTQGLSSVLTRQNWEN